MPISKLLSPPLLLHPPLPCHRSPPPSSLLLLLPTSSTQQYQQFENKKIAFLHVCHQTIISLIPSPAQHLLPPFNPSFLHLYQRAPARLLLPLTYFPFFFPAPISINSHKVSQRIKTASLAKPFLHIHCMHSAKHGGSRLQEAIIVSVRKSYYKNIKYF